MLSVRDLGSGAQGLGPGMRSEGQGTGREKGVRFDGARGERRGDQDPEERCKFPDSWDSWSNRSGD